MEMTALEHYQSVRAQLEQAGIEAAALEARELCAKVFSLDRRSIRGWNAVQPDEAQCAQLRSLCARRLAQEPLAYLLGEWDFYGMTFAVTPDVLIPRGDTEWLCDAACTEAKAMNRPRILDLCCGSGCIGIALAKQLPQAEVVGMDISRAALAVTQKNAERHEVNNYRAVYGDARTADGQEQYDLIVSNPPYITAQEMEELDESVRSYEPHLALYGGEDGLDFYRDIIRAWKPHLKPGGWLMFECGWKQGEAVAELMRVHGYSDVEIRRDLSGIGRIICGRQTQTEGSAAGQIE